MKELKYKPDEYVAAFRRIAVAPHHMRMLQAHYHAPQHTLTATQMSKTLGYPKHSAANLHYGRLGRLIGEELGWIKGEHAEIPEELDMTTPLYEGAVKRIAVNAYERSGAAREKCILHYGCRCAACGLIPADRYGETVQGLIHVHHVRQLAEINAEYHVDPIRDLRPVCPTCHAVIHSQTPPFTVEEIAAMIYGQEKKKRE